MKKLILLAFVAVMFVFMGCSKTKTCNCITKQSFDGEQIVTNSTLTIDKGKCEDMNATQTMTMDGEVFTQTVECTEQ